MAWWREEDGSLWITPEPLQEEYPDPAGLRAALGFGMEPDEQRRLVEEIEGNPDAPPAWKNFAQGARMTMGGEDEKIIVEDEERGITRLYPERSATDGRTRCPTCGRGLLEVPCVCGSDCRYCVGGIVKVRSRKEGVQA